MKDPEGICQSTQPHAASRPWVLSNDRRYLLDSYTPRWKGSSEDLHFWKAKIVVSKREQTQQVGAGWWLIRAWLTLFPGSTCDLRWMHLCLLAAMFVRLTDRDVIWSVFLPWTFFYWQRVEKKGGREGKEIKCFFPPQLSIWRGRKFDMVDLNTFSIISKQEVSPAAVFW